MKKITFILMLFISLNFHGQENKEKLQIESFSLTLGSYKPQKGNDEFSPWYVDFNLTTNYKNHLFQVSIDGTYRWLLAFIGESPKRKNIQISLLYGRRIKINNKFNFELFSGVGYLKETYTTDNFTTWKEDFSFIKDLPNNSVKKLSLNSFSVPIKLRLMFDYSKKASFGINYSHNFNSISNYNSTGLIFRHFF